MKPRLYSFLYKILLLISNKYNNKFIRQLKLMIGGMLLLLVPPLHAQEKKETEIPEIPLIQMENDDNEEDTILCYLIVEKMPEYPGGIDSLMHYLSQNIHYPPNCKNIEGKVVVQFTIERDGSTSNPTIIRSLDHDLDSIVIDVVRNMPKWKPGNQRGKPVAVRYAMPVIFRTEKP